MAAKRALVVDDSKSARAFLSRILERHGLEVDSAESAEEAIDYLTRHRPDVIFMDHLMPGMDGFQAVQAIKNNPRTATIPILMYTSQEGELYLGQARALGAIGVLPKQIRPTDVTQVLFQLHLAEDRRKAKPTWGEAGPTDATVVAPALASSPAGIDGAVDAPEPVRVAAGSADAPSSIESTASLRFPSATSPDVLLRDQIAELRRTVMARIDGQQDALIELVREAVRAEMPPPVPPVSTMPLLRPQPRRSPAAAITFAVLAIVFAALWWREATQRNLLESRLTALAPLPSGVAAGAAANASGTDAAGAVAGAVSSSTGAESASTGPTSPPLPASPINVAVPYGEAPLAGERVAAVRGFLDDLRRAGFHGDVEVQVMQGRFCLAGNAAEGFSLPPDELPQNRCDRMGNPALDGGGSRESLPFANMLGEQRRAARDAFAVRVLDAAERSAQPYPDAGASTTAGQWNAVAQANNRIELRWRERR